jgi:hypothetical protein
VNREPTGQPRHRARTTPVAARPVALAALAAVMATAMAAMAGPLAESVPAGTGERAGLRVVEQTAWVTPAGEFALVMEVSDAPPGGVLEVSLHEQRRSRIQFTDSLDGSPGPTLDRRCGTILDGAVAALDPCRIPVEPTDGDPTEVTVVLPVQATAGAPDRITLGSDGVYPVRVALLDAGENGNDDGDGDDEVASLVTHLVRLPPAEDDSPPLAVSVLLALGLPPARQPDGTVVVDVDRLQDVRTIAGLLGDHTGVPVVLRPRPDTLETLSDQGVDDVLEHLSTAAGAGQVLAAPAVDIDVGAWWAAGLDSEVERLLTTGRDQVAGALDVRPDRRTWWVEPTTDDATLARLRAAGVDQLVVAEELLDEIDVDTFTLALDRPFEVITPEGALVPAVMDDAALRAHLGSTGDPRLDAHHLLADLALLYFQQPGIPRGVAVSLPDDPALIPPAFLATVLEGIGTAPMLEAGTVDDLLEHADPVRVGGSDDRSGSTLTRRLRTRPPPDLGSYLADLEETRQRLAPYLAMAGDAPPAVVSELLEISADRRLGDDERSAYLQGALDQVSDLGDAVAMPGQPSVTLTSRQGVIPVEVVNRADDPVRVMVRLDSDKLDFPDGDHRVVALDPGPNRLEWEVRTRASGAFPVDLVVTSPDEVLELGRTRFTLRSTAVPGIGIALSGLAALFLAIWWARHWHSSRKTDLVPTDTDRILREIVDV